jgi:hypothetical protein
LDFILFLFSKETLNILNKFNVAIINEVNLILVILYSSGQIKLSYS